MPLRPRDISLPVVPDALPSHGDVMTLEIDDFGAVPAAGKFGCKERVDQNLDCLPRPAAQFVVIGQMAVCFLEMVARS